MQLRGNAFKDALRASRPQIGLWVGLADAYVTELLATSGFDWLGLDAEHAPNDPRSILAQLQAMAPYPVHAVVRTASGDATLIKQYLDIGAQTLLVPMVESAEQAQRVVAATRYPPAGIRGVGSALARASRWNQIALCSGPGGIRRWSQQSSGDRLNRGRRRGLLRTRGPRSIDGAAGKDSRSACAGCNRPGYQDNPRCR